MKIFTVILLLLVTTPAHAVQHWLHDDAGKATTPALGFALSTGSDAPPVAEKWQRATSNAVKNWSLNTQIRPFMAVPGFQRVTVYQDDSTMPEKCKPGYACASINRSNDIECAINIGTNANPKSAAFKKMLMTHESGHCYGLGHNDHIYIGDKADLPNEDISISREELMHASGCPDLFQKCGVTDQAKEVINLAY